MVFGVFAVSFTRCCFWWCVVVNRLFIANRGELFVKYDREEWFIILPKVSNCQWKIASDLVGVKNELKVFLMKQSQSLKNLQKFECKHLKGFGRLSSEWRRERDDWFSTKAKHSYIRSTSVSVIIFSGPLPANGEIILWWDPRSTFILIS